MSRRIAVAALLLQLLGVLLAAQETKDLDGEAYRLLRRALAGNSTFNAPRFWAAFFLTGDPPSRWSERQASAK